MDHLRAGKNQNNVKSSIFVFWGSGVAEEKLSIFKIILLALPTQWM